jgi:transposase-like protein
MNDKQCPYCRKPYSALSNPYQHVRECNDEVIPVDTDTTGPNCPSCEAAYNQIHPTGDITTQDLENIESYSCQKCGEKFVAPQSRFYKANGDLKKEVFS